MAFKTDPSSVFQEKIRTKELDKIINNMMNEEVKMNKTKENFVK